MNFSSKKTKPKKGASPKKSYSLVLEACKLGRLDDLKYLLRKGHSLEDRDQLEFNSLLHATANNHQSVVKYLIYHKSQNINYSNYEGKNALHLAVVGEHFEVVKFLLGAKIRVDEEDNDGKTPLMLSVQTGNVNIFELLISHGADIMHKDHKDNNILMEAILHNRISFVKYLVERELIKSIVQEGTFNIFEQNSDGLSPFMLAQEKNMDERDSELLNLLM